MDETTLETELGELGAQLEGMRARGFESHQDLLDYAALLGRLLQIEARIKKSAATTSGRESSPDSTRERAVATAGASSGEAP